MQIDKVKKVTEYKWINLFDVQYTSKAGQKANWMLASRRKNPLCQTGDAKPDAVVIVATKKTSLEQFLVVTKEWRVPLGGYEYGFPAGLVDEGETVADTAKRELKEETGLEVTRVTNISPVLYSSAGLTDESAVMVFVECVGEVSTKNNEETENIEVMLVNAKQALELATNADIKISAKAWFIFHAFGQMGYIA